MSNMKIALLLGFILFSMNDFAQDTIPAEFMKFPLKSNMCMEKGGGTNQFTFYILVDNVMNSENRDSFATISSCVADSLLPYLDPKKEYVIQVRYANRNVSLIGCVEVLFLINDQKVVEVYQMPTYGPASSRDYVLAEHQFIDLDWYVRGETFREDFYLYNILDEGQTARFDSLQKESKLLLLNLLGSRQDPEKDRVIHLTYISRYGMKVIKDYTFVPDIFRRTFNYYHRMLKDETNVETDDE